MNKTDAARMVLENELRRRDEAVPLRDRLRPLLERVLSRPATGQDADKAFYDEVSGIAARPRAEQHDPLDAIAVEPVESGAKAP